MKPAQVAALLLVVALAGLVLFLALRTRQAPRLPADREHAEFLGFEVCLSCHGPGGESPQSDNHPIGNDCLRCHGRR